MRRLLTAAMVVAALLCAAAGLGVVTHSNDLEARADSRASAYNGANPVDVAAQADDPFQVTVISDEYSTPAQRVTPVATWPLLLERSLQARTLSFSLPGAGYTIQAPGSEFGGTFQALAQQVPPDTKAVIFFGGGNDFRATPRELLVSSISAFAEAQVRAPQAEIVVVGPATTSEVPSQSLLDVRDVLRRAARTVGVRFVDPIAQGWLSEPTGILRDDGVNLTAKAHEIMETRMEGLVDDAVQ